MGISKRCGNKAQKKKHKLEAKAAKANAKQAQQEVTKPRVYVLDFKGSMDAHEVSSLREEVTAVWPWPSRRIRSFCG